MDEFLLNTSRDQIIRRISCEYLEMPGLRLTSEQAQRLWGLDRQSCSEILAELVATSFLTRTPDGRYARATEGIVRFPPVRMARAGLAGDRRRTKARRLAK
jgi:hypothetical protein